MPSIKYYNQTAPFWDFVATLEEQGSEHPMFSFLNERGPPRGPPPPPFDAPDHPFAGRHGGWGGRGGHHHHGRGGFGGFHGPPPPPPPFNESSDEETLKGGDAPAEAREAGEDVPMNDHADVPEGSKHGPGHGRHRHGGPRGRCGGRGGFRGWGGCHPPPPFMGPFFDFMQTQWGGQGAEKEGTESKDFHPEVDVFDTEEAFIVHVSLPGAKKEDVGVNWNADKSELSVAGVVYRPGDEEFLKTLAMDERKVGVFDRSVRLGSRTNPAQVDVEGISAKLEDGILRVTIPKLTKDDFVEVRRVDVE